MPIELATLRIRVSIAVPSVRRWLGRDRNATVESGTNTSPSPNPCAMLTTMMVGTLVWSVQPVMKNSESDISASPLMINVRASIYFMKRPTSIIATNVPQPRVASSNPAVMMG